MLDICAYRISPVTRPSCLQFTGSNAYNREYNYANEEAKWAVVLWGDKDWPCCHGDNYQETGNNKYPIATSGNNFLSCCVTVRVCKKIPGSIRYQLKRTQRKLRQQTRTASAPCVSSLENVQWLAFISLKFLAQILQQDLCSILRNITISAGASTNRC